MSTVCTREDFLSLVINMVFNHIYMTCKRHPIEIFVLSIECSNIIKYTSVNEVKVYGNLPEMFYRCQFQVEVRNSIH